MAKKKYEVIEFEGEVLVDVTVDLSLLVSTEELWFNATEMARSFGKQPRDFLKTQETKDYIEVISQKENILFDKLVVVRHGAPEQ